MIESSNNPGELVELKGPKDIIGASPMMSDPSSNHASRNKAKIVKGKSTRTQIS